MALTLLPFCVIAAVLFPPAYSFPLQGSISPSQTLLPLLLLFLHREPPEEISWPGRLPPGQVCSLLQFCHLPASWCSSSPSAEHCLHPPASCVLETFFKPSLCHKPSLYQLLLLFLLRIPVCQQRGDGQIQSEHPPVSSCLPSFSPRCLLNFSLLFSELLLASVALLCFLLDCPHGHCKH